MRLCITAEGPDKGSLIAEEFGHAPYFMIYDTSTGSWEAVPNRAGAAAEGAGILAAEQVISLEADVVLTGYMGVHGSKKLGSRNIRVIQDEDGTVEASVRRYMKKYGDACRTARTPARNEPPE